MDCGFCGRSARVRYVEILYAIYVRYRLTKMARDTMKAIIVLGKCPITCCEKNKIGDEDSEGDRKSNEDTIDSIPSTGIKNNCKDKETSVKPIDILIFYICNRKQGPARN